MTYQLASFRLRSIGERSARFTDLTLNTTQPRDGVNCPADSVFWLRNGGGKSSLLSLFYALMLPRVVDFMGRSVKRSLTDYVDATDTSHTVAVWHSTGNRTLLGEPGQILVTGAVYEWADLRRPVEPDKARDRLHTDYYAFYAHPGVLDATSLPVTKPNGEPVRRDDFLAALRQIADQHPQALDLITTDRQYTWQIELTNRGLDPDLFRTQKEMNHVEGGLEDLFRFPTARAFIDFLLDLTVSPDSASSVAERLSLISDVLAKKPGLVAERDFCLEMVSGLERVHHTQQDVTQARRAVDAANKRAADLAATFAATASTGQVEVERLIAERDPLQHSVSRMNTEIASANDLAYLYRILEAELRSADAQLLSEEALAAVQRAQHEDEAWAATEQLAEQAELQVAIDRTRADLNREREQVRPLIIDHDLHAARLRRRLAALADEQAEVSSAQAAEAQRLLEDAVLRDEASWQHHADAGDADRQAATFASLLDTLQSDLEAATRESVLPSVGTDPAQHAETLGEVLERRQRDLRSVQERRAARPEELTTLANEMADLSDQRARSDSEQAALRAESTAFQQRIAAFTDNGRVRELVEADDQVTTDVWAVADTLTRRLTDEIRQADEDLVRQEADRLEDRRLLDTHVRTGFLPTSLDADRVYRALIGADINATPGWTYIRDNTPAGQLAAALTQPDTARLGCGVVVPTESANGAVNALQHLDVTTSALVGVYTVTDAEKLRASSDETPVRPAWSGLHEGLISEDAASSAALRATVRTAEYEEQRQAIETQRNNDRALEQDFRTFLIDCPAGRLENLARRIAALDADIAAADVTLKDQRRALATMKDDDERDRNADQLLSAEVVKLTQTIVRLTALADRKTLARGWQDDLDDAERAAAQSRANAENATAEGRQTRDRAHQHTVLAETARQHAAAHRSERAAVTFLDADPGQVDDNHDETVEILRTRRQSLLRAHEIRVAGSVLEERLRTDRNRLSKVQSMLARTSPDVLATAAAFLHRPDGETAESRQVARVQSRAALGTAERDAGSAKTGVEVADARLREIKLRRTDPPTRRIPDQPTTPAAADALAGEQERTSQRIRETLAKTEAQIDRLRKQQLDVETRVKDFRNLLEDMPTPATEARDPYPGDDGEARDERRDVMQALGRMREGLEECTSQLTRTVTALRSNALLYATVTITAKDRILHDSEWSVAAKAHELAGSLKLRAATVDDHLAAIVKDQGVVAGDLAHLIKRTLDTLRKAERYSQLPRMLGTWAGKPMLTIRFEEPANDGELLAYVNRVIDRRIAAGVKPEGLPLLKDAVHEAVGPAGFKVKVLKPTEEAVAIREDITRLGKWSGGEKLTVCVALYCTIAALRSANSPHRGRSGGVLLLDNPIGRASLGSLVMLQRKVAAAHGVQLIYTTGVKDPDAVSRFPNVVRLDNRAGRTSNRRYIVENPLPDESGAEVNDVGGVRIAHDQGPADGEEGSTG